MRSASSCWVQPRAIRSRFTFRASRCTKVIVTDSYSIVKSARGTVVSQFGGGGLGLPGRLPRLSFFILLIIVVTSCLFGISDLSFAALNTFYISVSAKQNSEAGGM